MLREMGPNPTLCGRERSVSQRVVERADEQGHVLMPRTVSRPLTAGHVDIVVQPLDAVHHRLSRCLQTGLLGQLCCYHGNDFLQWTAQETEGSEEEGLLIRVAELKMMKVRRGRQEKNKKPVRKINKIQ